MKLVILSDTHNRHRGLSVPDGDVLIHCGDFSMLGQSAEVIDFLNWLRSQPHKHKIFIAGNHDRLFEKNPALAMSYTNLLNGGDGTVHYLQDSGIQIDGISFWGVPWTPKFGGWSFMLPRQSAEMRDVCGKIPNDLDVLITHGPPFGILDLSPYGNEHAGCLDLFEASSLRVKPKVHCFGHIHDGYGVTSDGDTSYINAAICDEEYNPVNLPVVVDV